MFRPYDWTRGTGHCLTGPHDWATGQEAEAGGAGHMWDGLASQTMYGVAECNG